MDVSQEEREYMRRIAAYKALSHAEAAAAHASRSVEERLRASWDLYLRNKDELFARRGLELESPDELSFYRRARALGLYEP